MTPPPKSSFGHIALPEGQVRWLGIGLIALAIVLPFAFLAMRAWTWSPDTAEVKTITKRPQLVILEAASFTIGSPVGEEGRYDDETQHQVTLTRAFALSVSEITQGQYAAVMVDARPVETLTDDFDVRCAEAGVGDDLPVVCVSWLDAVKFCNALSKDEELELAYSIEGEEVIWDQDATGYRLPTEAEWEYAARAGGSDVYVGTSDPKEVCRYANVADASLLAEYPDAEVFPCGDGFSALAPVPTLLADSLQGSTLKANAWWLHGLGGNAAEWVWDSIGVSAADASNRVIRGGSWGSVPRSARVASRVRYEPSRRNRSLGFRVARSWPSALLPSDPLPGEGPS